MQSRADVIRKASEDDAFRERLKADPRGTLEQELGTPLPAAVAISVLEETATHAYLVLPLRQAELSDEELAALAGGAGRDGSDPGLKGAAWLFGRPATG